MIIPDDTPHSPVSAIKAGFACRCPRCGKGKLLSGYLAVAERCTVCGLAFKQSGSGDGPAVLITLIVGVTVMSAALVSEMIFSPPLWLHLAVWIPFILCLSLGLLRPAKAILIAIQFRHVDGES